MGERQSQGRGDSQPDIRGKDDSEHPAGALYADADLSRQSESDFLRSAPLDLRKQLGLKADASSEQVYHKMAEQMVRLFPQASPEMQREALQSVGLKRNELNVDNAYRALIARDRRETSTADGASLADLEKAVHRKTYRQMKDGTLPIDYD